MKKRMLGRNVVSALLFALILIFPHAGAAAGSDWPHGKSDLEPDPDVVWGKLDNGFRYVLMKNTEPKDRVGMHLNVQAGSMNETEDERGLAHFLEHMLFQGSEHFAPGEMVKYFQSIGMQFGPDANAHTGLDETVYDIILPDGNEKSIADGLLVMKDYAQGALLLEEQIDSERKIILAEKRSRDSASYRTFEASFAFELPGSILPGRLPIGDAEVVKNADRELLKGFYDAWYRPEKMMLVMVGDFDLSLGASLIRENFSDVTARAPARPEPDPGKVRHFGIKPFYHFEEETGDASVSIEVVETGEDSPDSVARRQWLLEKDIADAIVQNRLDALLRKPETPFTSASAGSGIFFKKFFYAEISAKSSGENWEKSLAVIEQELRKALLHGFADSELARVKKEYMAKLETAFQKASTRNTRHLTGQIIGAVNSDRVFMSPKQELDLYGPMLEKMTVEQVEKAFKESWNKNHRLVLVTGNAPVDPGVENPGAYVLSRFKESREVEVSAPEQKAPVRFPYFDVPDAKGVVVEKREETDLGIVRIDFENGLRLNYKKTGFKAKEVLVELAFGPGKSGEPAGKPGLSLLAEAVIDESGVGPLNAEDLSRALAGKNTSVDFEVDEDAFVFKADTVPEEIDLMLQLLYAHIQDPAFRQEALELAMDRYRLAYMRESRSVEGAMKLEAERFLAGGDDRFGLPDHDSYSRLTLEDVRSWIGSALTRYPLEISVAGDFDPAALVESVSRYLGGLPPRSQPPDENDKERMPDFPEGRTLSLNVNTEIPKAVAMLAYPTDDFWDIGRTRRLSILGEIVSERLRVTIREKLGASYSPYAYNVSSRAYPGYGVFRAVAFVEPDEVRNLVDEMKQIATDLVRDGVDADELHRSLGPTLTSIKEMRGKNRYWVRSVLSGLERHPEQLEWARTIVEDYGSITAEEIMEMAATFLNNENAAEVVITPIAK